MFEHDKKAVVAIGGNSLIKDKSKISFENQLQMASETCEHLIDMIKEDIVWLLPTGMVPRSVLA